MENEQKKRKIKVFSPQFTTDHWIEFIECEAFFPMKTTCKWFNPFEMLSKKRRFRWKHYSLCEYISPFQTHSACIQFACKNISLHTRNDGGCCCTNFNRCFTQTNETHSLLYRSYDFCRYKRIFFCYCHWKLGFINNCDLFTLKKIFKSMFLFLTSLLCKIFFTSVSIDIVWRGSPITDRCFFLNIDFGNNKTLHSPVRTFKIKHREIHGHLSGKAKKIDKI